MSGNDGGPAGSSSEEWFDELFRKHHVAIRAYAFRRAPGEADDIVSEVFAVAWRKRDQAPDHPLPWLYAIAARETLHALRSTRRREHHHRRAAAQADLSAPDATEAVDARLSAQEPVRKALSALSARDQEVLRLWAWEHLDATDISTVLGISHAATRVRLHRARVRMERLLRAQDVEDPHRIGVPRPHDSSTFAAPQGGSS